MDHVEQATLDFFVSLTLMYTQVHCASHLRDLRNGSICRPVGDKLGAQKQNVSELY